MIRGGIAIFKYIDNASGTTLGESWYNMLAHKATARLIKPETLPPNRGCSCTAFPSHLSSNPGLDAVTKHVFESPRVWMDCRGS